jgi:putative FmdB family regulatory protein
VPLYEYQCARCGRFEVIRKFSDPPLVTCPTCGGAIEKLASAPAIQFKGTGWYITDYARKSGTGKSSSGKSDEGGGASSGSKDGGSASKDSGTKAAASGEGSTSKGSAGGEGSSSKGSGGGSGSGSGGGGSTP